MYTEQQDGFIALKKALTLLEVALQDSSVLKQKLYRLALFGFSHALAVFLTLPLGCNASV